MLSSQPQTPTTSEAHSDSSAAQRRRRRGVNHSKYKTRRCRNYSMGLPCRFGNNCAFAHGEPDPTNIIITAAAAGTTTTITTTTVAAGAAGGAGGTAGGAANISNISNISQRGEAESPPPPPYTEALQSTTVMPPAYTSRFRHDPYNLIGMVFVS